MDTPIVDFVKKYINSNSSRLHMPGHKGVGFLGCENLDITEIDGADVLGDASGIIKNSEDNASSLFSTAHSFYVATGSTTSICAMLYLACKGRGDKPIVLAARNVHKAFVHAAALLDIDIRWIMPSQSTHITGCSICATDVENAIKKCEKKPVAVYVTSPDYLGNILDIASISNICKKYDTFLLADNAHGAYLAFMKNNLHPTSLGAHMCADSAHKTLPVLTGGAYLHVSKDAPKEFCENARDAISLFSTTSPSYLILQSLDMCNDYISKGYKEELERCTEKIDSLKNHISQAGFCVCQSEALKIVIDAKKSGYMGNELAHILKSNLIEPEFSDQDYIVLMVTPQNTDNDFERIRNTFRNIKPRQEIPKSEQKVITPKSAMSVRQATLSSSETIDSDKALARVCAEISVSCPPAVPVVVSGEIITREHIQLLKYYGIKKIKVVCP